MAVVAAACKAAAFELARRRLPAASGLICMHFACRWDCRFWYTVAASNLQRR
jgi:hypothetical protein